MYSVALMVQEHENILKLLTIIENACCGILDGKELVHEDFHSMIAFARNYADKHHHGKEEQIFFQEMTDHLGALAVKLIQHGMLVEHDLGRLHIGELAKALEQHEKDPQTLFQLKILTEAMGYVTLLRRHIDKENEIVYTYAEKNFAPDSLQSVDQRIMDFEEEANRNQVQATYLDLLNTLEKKYNP